MKPAIAYGVVGSIYGGTWSTMAITSEKAPRRVYGRDKDGMPTQQAWGDVHGRFETQEEAERLVAMLETCRAAHVPTIKAATHRLEQAREARIEALRGLLKENAQ